MLSQLVFGFFEILQLNFHGKKIHYNLSILSFGGLGFLGDYFVE